MKTFKQVVSTISVLTFFSLSAMAGGVGNGGVSVVCRNQAGIIKSAQVLDIFEGEVRFGRKYNTTTDAETKIELAQLKLVKFPKFLEQFQKDLAKVKAIMTFVPKGNRLVPTNDAFPKIEKVGCDFEQLANYTDEAELLVSQEIYDELDELNKAALFVHETVYAILRKKNNVKDSQLARKLTAQLLAKNADQKVIDSILGGIIGEIRDITCGEFGPIEERINDCNFKKGNFVLVAKTKLENRVYKDINTGLLWGDIVTSKIDNRYLFLTQVDALKACNSSLDEVAGISAIWRLPSIKEFKEAEKSGINGAIPNFNWLYLTSSVDPENSNMGFVYIGGNTMSLSFPDNFTFYGTQTGKHVFRCVAR